jgi:hypothetical protein
MVTVEMFWLCKSDASGEISKLKSTIVIFTTVFIHPIFIFGVGDRIRLKR